MGNVLALNSTDAAELRSELLGDIDNWAAFCLPEEELFPFPDLYKYEWARHLECLTDTTNDIPHRLGLGLPRGFVKTTFLKLLASAAICYQLREFILVAGQREDRAQEFTRDVEHILISKNVRELFYDYDKLLDDSRNGKRTKTHKEFLYPGYNRPSVLMAIGANTSIRGVNINVMRPDWIIMDDVQSRECAESETENKALIAWVMLTLLKCGRMRGMTHTFLGNLYNDKCLLWVIKNNPEWETIITGAILENGEPLWPELKSYDALASEFRNDVAAGVEAGFFAEVQNDIRPFASRLMETSQLTHKELSPLDEYDGFFITIDPAGNKKNSDNTVVIAHGIRGIEIDHLEGAVGIMDPEQTIELAIELAIKYRVSVIFPEAYGYQLSLSYWLTKYLKEGGLEDWVTVQPLTMGNVAKNTRIRSWAAGAKTQTFFVCDHELRSSLVWEIHNFDTRRDDNRDDTLDCAAMAPIAWGKYSELIFVQEMTTQLQLASSDYQFRSGFSSLPLHSIQQYGY